MSAGLRCEAMADLMFVYLSGYCTADAGGRAQAAATALLRLRRLTVRAQVTAGDIRSAKGREKWESILRVHLLPEFGQMRCDEIRAWHVEQWRTRVAKKIAQGYDAIRLLRNGKTQSRFCRLAPNTANTWIALLRTLCGEMATFLSSIETPPRQRVRRRLGRRLRSLPPSICGATEIMQGTKTGTRERVYLPEAVVQALREHIALLEEPPMRRWGKAPLWWRREMSESDLLFLGRDGRLRGRRHASTSHSRWSRASIGLLVRRRRPSACGGLSTILRARRTCTTSSSARSPAIRPPRWVKYSTAEVAEQRQAIAKVIGLVALRTRRKGAGHGWSTCSPVRGEW